MTKRGLVVGTAIGLAMVAGLLAACGGSGRSGGSGNGGPANTAQNNAQAGLQAYVACLRQHGANVTLPSGRPSGVRPSGVRPSGRPSGERPSGRGPGGGLPGLFGSVAPSGMDQRTWDAALQACAGLRPSFGAGARRGGGGNSAFQAYRNCLREHGVTASTGPDGLNTADPAVAAAVAACAPLRPSARPSSS